MTYGFKITSNGKAVNTYPCIIVDTTTGSVSILRPCYITSKGSITISDGGFCDIRNFVISLPEGADCCILVR